MIDVFKETKEDWAPSFIMGARTKLLRVRFSEIIWNEPTWRVSVWGADDFGMEHDFSNESEAMDMFMVVIKMQYIEENKLRELGFINA